MGRQTGRLRSPFLFINIFMNILIMGDSWSYSLPVTTINLENGDHFSLENKLFSLGHLIFNKSIYGGTNADTLDVGMTLIDATKKIFTFDLVIWFHTELLRGTPSVPEAIYDYNSYLDSLHQHTLSKVLTVREKTKNAKWAIVGGHAPLHNPTDYSWADFKIDDWRSEIAGIKLPSCQSLSKQLWLKDNRNIFGDDVLYEEQNKYFTILDACKNKKDFYDGVHPSYKHTEKLAEKILNALF